MTLKVFLCRIKSVHHEHEHSAFALSVGLGYRGRLKLHVSRSVYLWLKPFSFWGSCLSGSHTLVPSKLKSRRPHSRGLEPDKTSICLPTQESGNSISAAFGKCVVRWFDSPELVIARTESDSLKLAKSFFTRNFSTSHSSTSLVSSYSSSRMDIFLATAMYP